MIERIQGLLARARAEANCNGSWNSPGSSLSCIRSSDESVLLQLGPNNATAEPSRILYAHRMLCGGGSGADDDIQQQFPLFFLLGNFSLLDSLK